MRHNRWVSTQSTSTPLQDEPANEAAGPDVPRWRAPLAVRADGLLSAVIGAAIALQFLPLWLGIPVAVVIAAWGLGLAVLGGAVVVNPAAGRVTLRMGLIIRRIRLVDITGVLVDEGKLSLARVNGHELSLVMWRKGRLAKLLRVPMVASDAGHAIASAVALAQAADGLSAPPAEAGRTPTRTRARLANAWICGAGAAEIAMALLVRVHWGNPFVTVFGVIIALLLGISGLLTLLVGIALTITGRDTSRSMFNLW